MDRIRFPCPQCGARIATRPEMAGKRGRCPACHAQVVVPDQRVAGEIAFARNEEDAPAGQPVTGQGVAGPAEPSIQRTAQSTAFAVASLVCGILAVPLSFVCVGLVPGVCAIVFYGVQSKRSPHAMATAGLVLGIVGVVLSVTIGGCIMVSALSTLGRSAAGSGF